MPLPRLALIPGECAGIGPELCVRLANTELAANLVAIGDADALLRAALRIQRPLELLEESDAPHIPGTLQVRHRTQPAMEIPGELDVRNAPHTIDSLLEASEGALRGEFDGMVTGPVHKGVVNDAGIPYTGTTELLARHADSDVVMMLASPLMRVALVTTHLPLRHVPDAVTPSAIVRVARIVHSGLRRDFGIEKPRILVLGLNPHAGENGHLGREEIDVIVPTLEKLRAAGMDLVGPLPADTAFLPSHLANCDAVIAMYHDQGLPVLKHGGFERAVNITLGLPYIRVAVDHGTALELAGTGKADASSLILAANIAAQLSARRKSLRRESPTQPR
jgi:4-hydroxythreonine-4-phosphate dehydrogenase